MQDLKENNSERMINMSNLTLKQKIILGIIISLMLIVIGIYGYISLNNDEELEFGEIISDNQIEGNVEENIDSNLENLEEDSRAK